MELFKPIMRIIQNRSKSCGSVNDAILKGMGKSVGGRMSFGGKMKKYYIGLA
jgi:hypothetical protein